MAFKFCPECGNKLNENYKFCPQCGFSLAGTLSAKEEEPVEVKKAEQKVTVEKPALEKVDKTYDFVVTEEDKRKAIALFEDNRCAQAFPVLLKCAEDGDIKCQAYVGDCYYFGYADRIDYETALYWYRKAAERGSAWAQRQLGHLYYNGDGVEENWETAFSWYEKAAEQGDMYAQHCLGECCEEAGDYDGAAYWYEKAAEQGHEEAILDLERLAEDGVKDAIEALRRLG